MPYPPPERRSHFYPIHPDPPRIFVYDGANISEVTKDMRLVCYIDMGFGVYVRPKLALSRVNVTKLPKDRTKIRTLLEGKSATLTVHSKEDGSYEAEVLISHPDLGNNVNVSDYLVKNNLAGYID